MAVPQEQGEAEKALSEASSETESDTSDSEDSEDSRSQVWWIKIAPSTSSISITLE